MISENISRLLDEYLLTKEDCFIVLNYLFWLSDYLIKSMLM
jgi:hypothetical protein